eukprot:scaffold1561_cov333-Pavlova_lutheri.AAC.5
MYLPACVDIPRRVCAPDKKSSQSPNARGCTIARWEFFKSIGVVTKAISSDCSVHKLDRRKTHVSSGCEAVLPP